MGKRAGTIKYLLWVFAGMIIGLAVLTLVFFLRQQSSVDTRADSLLAAGEYREAAELYAQAGDSEMQQHCLLLLQEQDYKLARISLQTGNYAHAKAALSELGDYKDSLNLLAACDYLSAGELMNNGRFSLAWPLLQGLDESYPGRTAALEKCSGGVYAEALSLAKQGDYAAALEIFTQLGEYEDAALLAEQTERMLAWKNDTSAQRILSPEKKYPNGYYENVYKTAEAYVVMPENPDSDCRFLVYFPGGKDDEINTDFLLYYLMNPAPDTIAVFLRSNGLYNIEAKSLTAVDILEKVSAECGVFPTELVSCGSSLGAYPAMQSAVYIPDNSAIEVNCVLSLDAGDDWDSPFVLSHSQCRELAGRGTEFYLFESPWVGTDRPAIKTMVTSGMNVILVGCVYDEHIRITLDAMGMGVLHWAVGDRTQPCELDIYSFNRLYA